MGFAVYHVEKGKGAGGGLGHHVDRTEGKEYTYKHADPGRKGLNVPIIGLRNNADKKPLPQAIKDRIAEGYKGKRAVRKDAVKYLSHVLTGSHEEMTAIFQDKQKKDAWIRAAAGFAINEFGKDNIVRGVVHLDEKTPHLHVITVPLTKDGRLSAKEIVGNKSDLQARQDRFAKAMEPFGLERGIRNTGIKHENAKDYYARINKANKKDISSDLEPVSGVFGVNKSKSIEKYQDTVKSLHLALEEVSGKYKKEQLRSRSIEGLRKKNDAFFRAYEREEKKVRSLEFSNRRSENEWKKLIMNNDKVYEKREEIEREIEQKRDRGRDWGISR